MAEAADGGAAEATVLVVDDDEAVADLYAGWVEDAGDYAAAVVHDGEAAVAAVEDGSSVDAMLLDHGLPDTDGDAVVSAVRERRPDLPVAMVTAAAVGEGETPADRRLTKPVMREDVTAAVEALLADGEAGTGADGDAGVTPSADGGTGLSTAVENTLTTDGSDGREGRREDDDGDDGEVTSAVSEALSDVTDRLDDIRDAVGEDGDDR